MEERLKLKGSFTLDDAQFTSAKIQNDVGQLSMRGQGLPKEARHGQGADVRSAMQSDFTMADATIALPNLKYTVPGAEIDLKGTYGVHGGLLNFTGTAKTEATVSEMVGGWKGALLKPADRYFKKDGAGTEVPIHVSGTRENPQFGVDLGRMKYTHPQIPGRSFRGSRSRLRRAAVLFPAQHILYAPARKLGARPRDTANGNTGHKLSRRSMIRRTSARSSIARRSSPCGFRCLSAC